MNTRQMNTRSKAIDGMIKTAILFAQRCNNVFEGKENVSLAPFINVLW